MLDIEPIQFAVAASIVEDVGSGDITAALLPESQIVHAHIRTNETAVICGQSWADETYRQIDPDVSVNWKVAEGEKVAAGQCLAEIQGRAKSVLTGERVALNWLQTLSGTATMVSQYVSELEGFKTRLLDTRKTIPGLRYAQKYAVNIGGGVNHRQGLFDAFLIKENHIISCGSIKLAIEKARALFPDRFLEIEVENLSEFQEALSAQPDRIMLDNFSLDEMQKAVQMNHANVELEVSGNVTLASLSPIAKTGVDFISVGAITKHIQAVDLSMRLQVEVVA